MRECGGVPLTKEETHRARRIRIFGLMLLLLLGATSLMALPDREQYVEFYPDDTYETLCGYRWILCFGIYESGCNTPYYIETFGPDC